MTQGFSTTASMVFQDANTLWTIDLSTFVNTITKYTRTAVSATATWTKAAGYPKWGFNSTTGA